MPAPLAGALFQDRFLLEARAGAGGSGVVFRARDLRDQRLVAVKLLERPRDPAAAQRFAREAGLLLQLRHPGIVGHVAQGVDDDGTPFLVMEWIEGESLASRVARSALTA